MEYDNGLCVSLKRDTNHSDYKLSIQEHIDWLSYKRRTTIDSILYDLNIVKPIGYLEYTSEWIDKILSGQNTMDILPTQYMCGHYELWDTDRQEVRGIVEVTNTQKLSDMDSLMRNDITSIYNRRKVYNFGFDSVESFIAHHRTHFQSVKYAITYWVVDMKGDAE